MSGTYTFSRLTYMICEGKYIFIFCTFGLDATILVSVTNESPSSLTFPLTPPKTPNL